MSAPEAKTQIVSGIYDLEGQWRWTSGRAMLLLKPPLTPAPLQFKIFIPDPAPARKITVSVDNTVIHEADAARTRRLHHRNQAGFRIGGDPVRR